VSVLQVPPLGAIHFFSRSMFTAFSSSSTAYVNGTADIVRDLTKMMPALLWCKRAEVESLVIDEIQTVNGGIGGRLCVNPLTAYTLGSLESPCRISSERWRDSAGPLIACALAH
jgi:hypothetical protein